MYVLFLLFLEYAMYPTTRWASFKARAFCEMYDARFRAGDIAGAQRAARLAIEAFAEMRGATATKTVRLRRQGRHREALVHMHLRRNARIMLTHMAGQCDCGLHPETK